MSHCTACGAATEAAFRFCPQCGAGLLPGGATGGPRVLLEEVIYRCESCGREEPYGKLTKCRTCHDRTCAECTGVCKTCNEPTCPRCLLDCDTCKEPGCRRCLEVCETCQVRAMCPKHVDHCDDCQYPTCAACFTTCSKCELDVCTVCRDEAHDPKRRGKHIGG